MGPIALADHRSGANSTSESDLEHRVVDAGLRCVARWGLAKTTVDDIAREAGCGRATVYRAFPGGRDALLAAMVAGEVERLQDAVAASLDRAGDLEGLLVAAVSAATAALRASEPFQSLLAHEPEVVVPHLSFEGLDRVLAGAAAFAGPWLRVHLDPTTATRTAEWLVRLVLAHLSDGSVDLADPAEARRLVRRFVLPGLPGPDHPSRPVPSTT